ncbi:hypothetical protein GBAR_LOCUS4917 [Geodia barretti]|uniref:Uncharacterized protein n=1 Tax=Geodia barretti TaxID=519541 RepID=A0AA35R8Z2_GEOBA|nr:hypothetical protein GBAR_LOCUS4917 [Geodia barretti]
MDVKNISLSSNRRVSTYTLSANKNFSIFFEVFTAAGPVNVSHDTFTTYDVQSLSVEEEGGGVLVRGEFMRGSRAAGCLVVLQGPPSSPDMFRALLRTQSQDTVSTVPVPPSTYTVYGYDLEENGLPNTMPAVVLENQILVNSDADSVKPSIYLKGASISRRGSTVVIDCEFSEVYPEASCVLVYREYGSPLLTVVDIPQLFDFPVSITVDSSPENYTFALFWKNGAMSLDEEPLVYTKFSDSATDKTDGGKEEGKSNSQRPVVAISIGTVVMCVLVCGSAVVVLVMIRRYHNHSKFTHASDAAGLQTRNVVYERWFFPQPPPHPLLFQLNPTQPMSPPQYLLTRMWLMLCILPIHNNVITFLKTRKWLIHNV